MTESSLSKLSADYLSALRLHLEGGSESPVLGALDLGTNAVEMGVGTLELATIHDSALTKVLADLAPGSDEDATITGASIFFYEALTLIEETHCSAREAALQLQEINSDLNQRTKDLAASRLKVMREMGVRRLSEAALHTSGETAAELIVESRLLESELRDLTRRTLSASESEREQMSLHLQGEIAQTLLGIHVRLLSFKRVISTSHESFAEQIATTQSLLAQSVKAISSLATTIDNLHES